MRLASSCVRVYASRQANRRNVMDHPQTLNQTQDRIDHATDALIDFYNDMPMDAKVRILCRNVMAGVDCNSPTMQALAGMVFLDHGGDYE
jgi:hypothetical protein